MIRSGMKACRFTVLFFLAHACSQAGSLRADETGWSIHLGEPRTYTATYSFQIDVPNLKVERWSVYVAIPPTFAGQSDVIATVQPKAERINDLSDRARPVWHLRQKVAPKANPHQMAVRVDYRFTLRPRHLLEQPSRSGSPPPALSKTERAFNLAETKLIDFRDPEFQRWLDETKLRRQKQESPLSFARRVFLHLKHSQKYEYLAKMDRHATQVCRMGRTDCGGMSILFTSILRAADIPCRVMSGRWAKSAEQGAKLGEVNDYQQTHVKAEFFVDSLGWVPVDVSSAVLHDHSETGLQYFGHDRGDFVVLHIDPEISVETPDFGRKEFEWLQSMQYFVWGKGELKNTKIEQHWQVARQ